MDQILYKRTRTVIREWGDRFVADLKADMNIDKTVASGLTRDSIEGKFHADSDEIGYTIESRHVNGVPILNVIDTGRRPGKRPPVNAILAWMEAKNVQPRDAAGRYKTKSLTNMKRSAYLIARAIGQKGTIQRFGYKGSDIFQWVIVSKESQMTGEVEEAFRLDLEDYLDDKIRQK